MKGVKRTYTSPLRSLVWGGGGYSTPKSNGKSLLRKPRKPQAHAKELYPYPLEHLEGILNCLTILDHAFQRAKHEMNVHYGIYNRPPKYMDGYIAATWTGIMKFSEALELAQSGAVDLKRMIDRYKERVLGKVP
jgi:hypothetical protein